MKQTLSAVHSGKQPGEPPPFSDSYEQYLKSRGAEGERIPVYRRVLPDAQRRKKTVLYVLLIAAIAVAVISLAFLIRSISENREYSRYMSAAQSSTLSGEYDNALASLRKAASIDMSDECLLMMAQCYEALGNYDRAIEALRYMKTSDAAINAKVASIEAKKKTKEEENMIIVAGTPHSASETNLVLDGCNLDNEVLQEVSRLYALNNLSLAENRISDISALSSLGGLTTLNLSGNKVRDLTPLSGLTGLRTLYLDYNPVVDFTPLYSLTSLTTLSIRGISVSAEALRSLSQALPNCAINGAGAGEADSSGVIALGGETFSNDVATLDLSGHGLTDISALSACEKLTSLNLSGNYISDITPLMDIPGLQTLNISSNSVTDLRPLMGLSALKVLNAASNSVSSTVPLGNITSLQELNLANNPINNFAGISKLKNLSILNLSGTGFSDTEIDVFTYLAKLVNLNVEHDPGLSGEGYEKLQHKIPACYIQHSNLVYSVAADAYTVASNTTELDMTGRGISDLSFLMQLGHLVTVRLGSNNITELYYFLYTESWRSIETLDLSANRISDVSALMGLKNLRSLNLSYNQISDINPLFALTELRELDLTGNPLSADQVWEINRALPYCTVIFS